MIMLIRKLFWLSLAASAIICLIITVIYGIDFSYKMSICWLIIFLSSVIIHQYVLDPIFVYLISFKHAKEKKNPFKNEPNEIFETDKEYDSNELFLLKKHEEYLLAKFKNWNFQEKEYISDFYKNYERETIRFKEILQDLIMFTFYLCALLLIVLGTRNPLAYNSSSNIKNSLFLGKYGGLSAGSVKSTEDLFNFINSSLVENFNKGRLYTGEIIKDDYGWLHGKNIKILGVARLRQHRLVPEICHTLKFFEEQNNTKCLGKTQDFKCYGPKWKEPINITYSKEYWRMLEPWCYKTPSESKTLPILGSLKLYPGGGYVSQLGRTYNNSLSVLNFLKKTSWIDSSTAVVFVEFTLYSADADLFNVVTLIFEKTPQGLYIFHHNIKSVGLLFTFQNMSVYSLLIFIMFLILVAFFLYRLMSVAMQSKLKLFLLKPWNIIDTIIVTLSITAIGLFYTRNIYVEKLLIDLEESRNNEFISFFYATLFDDFFTYLSSCLVCLATIRIWKILNFALVFRILSKTLLNACPALAAVLSFFLIILAGLCTCMYIINGSQTIHFATYIQTMQSLLAFYVGFPEEVQPSDIKFGGEILGIILYAIQMIIVQIFVLNMFIITVCYYFSTVKDILMKNEKTDYTFCVFLKNELNEKFANILGKKIKPKKPTEDTIKMKNIEQKIFLDHISENIKYLDEKTEMVNKLLSVQFEIIEKYLQKLS